MDLYLKNALKCSKETTNNYSTSFSLGVSLLDKTIRDAIYAIYGFVRFSDEIVDTFYEHNQKELLNNFKSETFKAIEEKISTNPILHSFQWAVNKFNIEHHLINSFLYSMEMDLLKTTYSDKDYKTYIYGSAEVVGLMCLQVFCKGDPALYMDLIHPARKLGEAFQKVNFLRDIESDFEQRGRTYFPNINLSKFTTAEKIEIENDINNDFEEALIGISKLPLNARFGVYLAYTYYLSLLNKINKTPADILMKKRIRISNFNKIYILFKSYTIFTMRQGKIQRKRKPLFQKSFETIENKAYA